MSARKAVKRKRIIVFILMGWFAIGCSGRLVKTESGLQYQILQRGEGRKAKVGDEILLIETTSYRDGTVLYSNEKSGNAVKVLIGGNQATQAVDEGLRGMRTGEIRLLIAAPHLVKRKAYPENVSPDSTLVIKMIVRKILAKQ
jgi:FKBP-type peptidyl-prolyl cis-trans isomerase